MSGRNHRGGDSSTPVSDCCATESDRKNVASKVETAPGAWENYMNVKSPAGVGAPTGRNDQLSNRVAETEVTLNESIVDPVARREARDQAVALLEAATVAHREAREREHMARVNLDRYIHLCKLHGLRLCDISEVTGLSSAGVSNAVMRARDLENRQESGVA